MAMCGIMWTIATSVCPSCLCKARIVYRFKSNCLRDIISLSSLDCRYKTSLGIKNQSLRNTEPYIGRLYLSNSANDDKNNSTPRETNQSKKPKEIKTFITVYGIDKSMYITTVEDATKLAERRNFKLVKLRDYDTKSGRAVYKLMTESQFLKYDEDESENDSANKSTNNVLLDSTNKPNKVKGESHIKGEKAISLNSTISENDTKTKIKMMKKWLSKMLQVKVLITGDTSSGEKVCQLIEKEIGTDGRILKKKSKGGMFRLEITPPKNAPEKKSS